MCEYCKGIADDELNKDLFKINIGFKFGRVNNTDALELYGLVVSRGLEIRCNMLGYIEESEIFPIKYCPLCGESIAALNEKLEADYLADEQ